MNLKFIHAARSLFNRKSLKFWTTKSLYAEKFNKILAVEVMHKTCLGSSVYFLSGVFPLIYNKVDQVCFILHNTRRKHRNWETQIQFYKFMRVLQNSWQEMTKEALRWAAKKKIIIVTNQYFGGMPLSGTMKI